MSSKKIGSLNDLMIWTKKEPVSPAFSKIFFLKGKRLSDDKVVSLNKKEYSYAVHFSYIFTKSLKSVSDEWFIAICWSSLLFGFFIKT